MNEELEDLSYESVPPTHENVDLDSLKTKIKEKKSKELNDFVAEHDPVDFSTLIDEFSDAEILFFFKVVNSEFTAMIFSYLDPDTQQRIATSLTSDLMSDILDELSTDDLVDFVEELPSNLVKQILHSTNKDEKDRREKINAFLRFEKNTAGSLMTTEFVEIKDKVSVQEALNKIRTVGPDAETIQTCFVLGPSRTLIGILDLDDLLFSQLDANIEDLVQRDFVSVGTGDDQEDVADLFRKYDLSVMPVVDSSQRLVGIITVDDILDVIEKETTEDMHKMSGSSPLGTPYLKTSVYKLAKSRILWLLLLMISATLTGLIINKFEHFFTMIPVLSVFIPMLMDTSGNAGNQTTTTVIRALAIGDVHLKDYPRVLLKEFLVSLITGVIIAVFNFLWIFVELKTGFIGNASNAAEWIIALQVSATLFFIVILAKCLGSSLPMFAKLIHVDPALMAGPMITTILDTLSLLIYFVIAKAIIPGI